MTGVVQPTPLCQYYSISEVLRETPMQIGAGSKKRGFDLIS